MRRCVPLLIFVLLLVCSCGVADAVSTTFHELETPEELLGLNPLPGSAREYLHNNAYPVSFTAESFSFLSKDFHGKDVILCGEYHAVQDMIRISLPVLQYLHMEADVHYFIEEIDYLTGCTINEYLASGDETVLHRAFDMVPSAGLFRLEEKYAFYTGLYHYNQTLPPEQRIEVFGIDYNKQNHQPYIERIRETATGISGHTVPVLERMAALPDPNSPEDIRTVRNTLRDFRSHATMNESMYVDALGDMYTEFVLLVNQELCAIEYNDPSYTYREQNIIRDRMMYDNLIIFSKSRPDSRFFGQLGSAHVMQSQYREVTMFAGLLDADGSPFHGRVLSIYFMADNCKTLNGTLTVENLSEYETHLYPMRTIAQELGSSITAFRLTDDGSPFTEGLYYLDPYAGGSSITTDYIQLAILFRNSRQATPMMR
ncbi:MAG: hypothetical protein ACOC2H_06665, partial [Spirochaetota bacterium]